MNRSTMSYSLLVVLICGGWSTAGPPPVPIDRPTPPPCAADGICYPNVEEWGYYPGRWRRWPGQEPMPTAAEPTPAERLGPDVAPYELPSPEKEDERAPPASTKREPIAPVAEPSGEAPTTEGVDSPTTPGYPPPLAPPAESNGGVPAPDRLDAPTTPGYPSPLVPPAEPTTDLDPPPAPPFAKSAAMRAPRDGRPRAARSGSASDPPPAMPWTDHRASL